MPPASLLPPLPPKVLPGQLISSELMNAIIEELARARSAEGSPTVTTSVPNVFGFTLQRARQSIAASGSLVSLGSVLDISGAAIDIVAQANQSLIVLNQSPSAGVSVPPGTPLNLLLSRPATTPQGPTTPNPPTLTRLETLGGVAAAAFAVGEPLVVIGTNFSLDAFQNQVLIGGVLADAVSRSNDPTRVLDVRIPTGIPNAPTAPGGNPLSDVTLELRVRNVSVDTRKITINPPPGTPQPVIERLTSVVQVGGQLQIGGKNFGPKPERNRVFMTGTPPGIPGDGGQQVVPAVVTSATTTELLVAVPDFGDLGRPADSTKLSLVTVEVLDEGGNLLGRDVSRTSTTVIR